MRRLTQQRGIRALSALKQHAQQRSRKMPTKPPLIRRQPGKQTRVLARQGKGVTTRAHAIQTAWQLKWRRSGHQPDASGGRRQARGNAQSQTGANGKANQVQRPLTHQLHNLGSQLAQIGFAAVPRHLLTGQGQNAQTIGLGRRIEKRGLTGGTRRAMQIHHRLPIGVTEHFMGHGKTSVLDQAQSSRVQAITRASSRPPTAG